MSFDVAASAYDSFMGRYSRPLARLVVETELTVTSDFASFDDWWSATAVRVGPIAAALDALDADGIERVRAATRQHWGDGAFTVTGTAWAARGTVR